MWGRGLVSCVGGGAGELCVCVWGEGTGELCGGRGW